MKTWFLVIILGWPNNGYHQQNWPTDSLAQCLDLLKATRIHTPSKTTENEWIATATCAQKTMEDSDAD